MLRNLWKLLLNLQLVSFTIMFSPFFTKQIQFFTGSHNDRLHFNISQSSLLSFFLSLLCLFLHFVSGATASSVVLAASASRRAVKGPAGPLSRSWQPVLTHAEVADVWTLSFRFSVIFRAWCVCLRSLLRPLTFHLLVTQPLFLTVSADLYSNITVGEKNSKTEKSSSRWTCNSHSSAWEGSVSQPQSNLIPD